MPRSGCNEAWLAAVWAWYLADPARQREHRRWHRPEAPAGRG